MITVNGGGIDIDNDDDVRLRFDNAGTFKAGLQVVTTTGDMIAGSAVNDFAIRSQGNMLFASGGNTERLKLDTSGNATFVGDVTVHNSSAGYSVISGDGNGAIYSSNGDVQFFTNNSAYAINFYAANKGDKLLTIANNGDTMIGNTVVNPASGFASQKGFGYDGGTGQTQIATTDNASTLVLGRNNATDGSIIDLRKESGVIGTFGSNTTGGEPLLDISANATNGNMRFVTAGSEALRIDSSQNVRTYAKLGIRVDGDAISWRGTAQIPAVINLAGNGALFTRPDQTFLSQNFYYDASDIGAVIDAGQGAIVQCNAGEIIFSGT